MLSKQLIEKWWGGALPGQLSYPLPLGYLVLRKLTVSKQTISGLICELPSKGQFTVKQSLLPSHFKRP